MNISSFIRKLFDGVLGDSSSNISRYDDEERAERLLEEYEDLFYVREDGDEYELNDRQKEAVVKLGDHNQVVAGAGTGKTFSLTFRAKFLVEEGVEPNDIVALTFTKDAAKVMEKRLSGDANERMFNESINVGSRTLHSLGANVLRQVYEFEQLAGPKQHTLVEDIVHDLWHEDPEFRDAFQQFREVFKKRRFEPDHPGAIRNFFYSHVNRADSLAGTELPDYPSQERRAHETIADFLFENGVEYRYQQLFTEATKTNNQPYFRLFGLPEHDLTVEYALSRNARKQKPSYDRRPGASELKRIHGGTDHDIIVIEHDALFDGEKVDTERLERYLKNQLQRCGIDFGDGDEYERQVPEMREFHDSQHADREQWRVYCYNKLWTSIIEEFLDFVTKAKENQKDPHEQLRRADKSEHEEAVWTFSRCAVDVYDEYVSRLDGLDIYDFSDLIIEATDLLEDPPASLDVTQFSYEHVMVDEFQDLNLTQLELVQALLDLNDDACLFAIGDDWQSIYGFKAAKPEYFIDFEKHFSPCTRTELQVNYRCDDEIVEAGNTLIENNDGQIEKTVRAFSDDLGEINVHTIPSTDTYEESSIERVVDLVENSEFLRDVDGGQRGGDIMVLARTRAGSPFIQKIRRKLRERNVKLGSHEKADAVTVDTAHSAKGEEAEHVIAVNVTESAGGFPTTESLSLQELIETRPSGEEHYEEERRLFYVVVTRAKSRLDIQTSDDSPSRFISEIRNHVQFDDLGDPTALESLAEMEGERLSAAATVVDQYSPNVGHVRLDEVSTESGSHLAGTTIKYVQFTDLEPTEGVRVELTDALVNEYQGDIQLKIDDEATFEVLDA